MITRKKWTQKDFDSESSSQIAEALSLSPITAALLSQRGCYDKKSALSFINKENATMHDPFLLTDMDKAVMRIVKAVHRHDKVMVYGDYDVDGITGTSVLVQFFRGLGLNVGYHIPERLTEGYGVNSDAVKGFVSEHVSLIVTVDTGITANEEVKLANELGMDVIVTDHHECREKLPDAVAVIDPKRPDNRYPFTDLAGVGVAFKLICAYNCYITTGRTGYDPEDRELIFEVIRDCYKQYGDIVALGTIADVMPVMGENRLIIAYGLNKMKKTKNKGLLALLRASEIITGDGEAKKITSTSVGFILAPRINAAGRLGSASRAVEMFLTDSDDQAAELAAWLCDMNKERQSVEIKILQEAEEQIAKKIDVSKNRIIILDSDTWHHGVIGIVASRITDKYHLPCILISFDGSEGDGKGSGRSIDGFDLLAAITACSEKLVKYGGHKYAAGLSLCRSDLDAFREMMTAYANEHITDDMLVSNVEYDHELTADDVSVQLANELSKLEPYGEGNPVPLFLMRDVKVTDIIPLKEGKHTRICFTADGKPIQAMYFGMPTSELPYIPGDRVDILLNLSENEYRGTVSAQVLIRDMRYTEDYFAQFEADMNVYEYICDDIILPQNEHIPNRDDCAAVFKLIKKHTQNNACADINANKAVKTELKNVEYVKFRFILDIFTELGLIQTATADGITFSVKLLPSGEKRPLASSHIYQRLNGVD